MEALSICVRRWTWYNGAHCQVSHDAGPVRVRTIVELSLTEHIGSTLIEDSQYSKTKGTEKM